MNGNTYNKLSEATLTFEDRAPLSDEVLNHSVDLSEAIIMPTEAQMDAALTGKVVATDKPVQNTTPQSTPQPKQSTPSFNTMEPTSNTADLASQALASQATQEPTPQPQSQPTQSTPSASPERTCPCGYDWGTADDHPECKTCKVWDRCIDG